MSAQEIAKSLHEIGISKAQKIVEYKIRFDPIAIPEELLAIIGFGKKPLDKDRAKMIMRLIQSPKPTNPVRGLDEIRPNHYSSRPS